MSLLIVTHVCDQISRIFTSTLDAEVSIIFCDLEVDLLLMSYT